MKIINKSILVCIIFIIIASVLYAVDDQAILQVKIREALHYEQQGNSQEAERLYNQLLEDFPHNGQVISRLVYLYFRTNNLDKLKVLLSREKEYLNKNYYQITQMELLLKENNLDQAHDLAESMLIEARTNAGVTRQIAQLYQRYSLYEDAVRLYLRAREESSSSQLFAQELAQVYQAMDRPYDAMDEYLNILDEKNYSNVRYRIEKLDLSTKEILTILQAYKNDKPGVEINRLIGEFYVLSKQYQKAFELYQSQGNDALIQLATIAEKQQLYDLAIQCLTEVLKTTADDQTILFLENRIGGLHFLNNDHIKAYEHYMKVIDLYQNTKAALPLNVMYNVYKNVAMIELFYFKDTQKSQLSLEKALEFALANNEKASLSIMLSQCYLQQEDYVKGEAVLNDVLHNKPYSKDMKDLAKTQLLQTMILRGDFAQADTLAKEYLTHDYESLYVNDIGDMYRTINQELHLAHANADVQSFSRNLFYDLYFNNSPKILDDYNQLAAVIQDSSAVSYTGMKVADYFFDQGDYETASVLYEQVLENNESPYVEYCIYRIADCMLQLGFEEKAETYYTDYLLVYPQGTFAPEIRLILKKLKF